MNNQILYIPLLLKESFFWQGRMILAHLCDEPKGLKTGMCMVCRFMSRFPFLYCMVVSCFSPGKEGLIYFLLLSLLFWRVKFWCFSQSFIYHCMIFFIYWRLDWIINFNIYDLYSHCCISPLPLQMHSQLDWMMGMLLSLLSE